MKYIPEFLKNDSAVSFGLIVIAVFLTGITAIWIVFAPAFNNIFTLYNSEISQGIVTQQNQKSMQFHQKIIYITPIIILIGLICWAFIRALEQRNQP